MDIRTLAEMQESDRRSLMSYVWTAEPAQAAELAQYAIGQIELAPAVPDTTRQAFERLCTLFAYGILCYDLYTVAGDLAEPSGVDDDLVMPLVWEAAGPLGLSPRFEGKLRLAGLDPERCELTLSGHSRPPLGRPGQVLDEALLARVARAALRAFLRRVARACEEEQPSHPAPAQSSGR